MDLPSRISEEEIDRFLDGELPPDRHAAIEAALATDPALADRIAADRRIMDALAGARAATPRARAETLARARALERSLRAPRHGPALRRAAIAAGFVAAGWFGHAATGWIGVGESARQEDFLAAARHALRLAELDAGVRFAEETAEARVARLAASLDIAMPALPASWVVRDVRLHPWNGRTGLVVTADTARLGTVTLVAAAAEGEDLPPRAAGDPAMPTIAWRAGRTTFALMGSAAPVALKAAAEEIGAAPRPEGRRAPLGPEAAPGRPEAT
ncbi:anti-sigma factor family protein [Prosthecomicrobium pneumaticum]|uniref:Anti-sigma factor RsiW n=1 Tax=Prosthecomicrobium pneumaticum TaxID=81895 RepID=A0A7W9CT21_9HYPH|nr:hypothetical protein [Prosthecomicrobium pneumaticum]MBB5751403.1 anti-sigma factor RsiW [Prosthecomicrobium pneumaticum]